MPAVDKIFVEVTADLRTLDRDLRVAEQRVDKAATTMQRSMSRGGSATRLTDKSLGGRQAWLGGMSVVGGMLAVGRALNSYQAGSMSAPYGGNGGGDFGAAVLDWTDALMKSVPILDQFYEAGKKLSDSMFASASDKDLRFYGTFNEIRGQMGLATRLLSPDPEVRRAAEIERARIKAQKEHEERWTAWDKEFPHQEPLPPFDPNDPAFAMMSPAAIRQYEQERQRREQQNRVRNDYWNDSIGLRNAEIEAAKRAGKRVVPGGVDSFNTPLGDYRAPWKMHPSTTDDALDDIEQNTKDTAVATKQIARAMKNGVRFVMVA